MNKEILGICAKLDKDGQYRLADQVFKFAQDEDVKTPEQRKRELKEEKRKREYESLLRDPAVNATLKDITSKLAPQTQQSVELYIKGVNPAIINQQIALNLLADKTYTPNAVYAAIVLAEALYDIPDVKRQNIVAFRISQVMRPDIYVLMKDVYKKIIASERVISRLPERNNKWMDPLSVLFGTSSNAFLTVPAEIPLNTAPKNADLEGTMKDVLWGESNIDLSKFKNKDLAARIPKIAEAAKSVGFSGNALTTIVAIACAESTGDPTLLGDKSLAGQKTNNGQTWGPSVGLWQIRTIVEETGRGTARDIKKLMNPVSNAQSAMELSGGKNWCPWSVFKNGAYLRYCPMVEKIIGGQCEEQYPCVRRKR